MLVSIIIPTYNRERSLERALHSVLEDSYPNKEVVVVDGASKDNTVKLLREFNGRIKWISEPDRGEYDARNKCLQLASGALIRYMSDDDVLVAGSLSIAVEHFRSHPETGILFGQSIQCYECPDGRLAITDSRKRSSESVSLRNFLIGYAPHCPSETAFVRRSVIDRLGAFDTTWRLADSEFWTRAAAAGIVIALSDSVFVQYMKSRSSGVEKYSIAMSCLAESWRRTVLYGSVADLLYLALWRIPFLIFVRSVYAVLPWTWVFRFRQSIWRWRNRNSSVVAI